jgi:hypothetical protein
MNLRLVEYLRVLLVLARSCQLPIVFAQIVFVIIGLAGVINILVRHHLVDFIGPFGVRIIVAIRISSVLVRFRPCVVDVYSKFLVM